jgi:hypothetical protein
VVSSSVQLAGFGGSGLVVASSARLAGFASVESVVTSMAGLAGTKRPRGSRSATPASFK